MNILIVDDSKAMRMIVKRTIKKAGFTGHTFIEASNGEQAFRTVESAKPDLILCDWNMPRMTGIQLLEKLQAERPGQAFGFVTSEGTKDMRARAANAGALFLIAKPFTVEAFKEALGPVIPKLEDDSDSQSA